MSNAREFLAAIKGLSAPYAPAVRLANAAAQEALSNLDLRISQFEENLTNPLPSYLFDGQSAIVADLRRKREALIAGRISAETAMSVDPLPPDVTEELPTEALVTAIATMPTVEQPTDAEAPANADLSIAASEVPNPQIDAVLIAALVTRIRTVVVHQVIAEAAKMVIEAKKKAIADAVVQIKQEQTHGE